MLTKERLQQMNEAELRKEVLIPLLKAMGYQTGPRFIYPTVELRSAHRRSFPELQKTNHLLYTPSLLFPPLQKGKQYERLSSATLRLELQ